MFSARSGHDGFLYGKKMNMNINSSVNDVCCVCVCAIVAAAAVYSVYQIDSVSIH